ncbi:hypothetical protein FHS15_000621 [Paenibacillus castaneae]|uniref:hypothetical protein n=1 Tax=Paenibacillus castaneae TaxID=474957 RepID=UPI000C9A8110|nr:hypothetical protein [Paenibacillus castaneae]NIK75521.1 hypothetical protein [Paenibacillus castaneae]
MSANYLFAPHEAYDMILFLNAVSDNSFYNQHYLDVRQSWEPRLGDQGLKLINEVCSKMSMSYLCTYLSAYGVKTLDDIITVLQNYSIHAKDDHLIADHWQLLSDCFQILKEAGLPIAWNQRVKPYLQDIAEQYEMIMEKVYPLHKLERTLTIFLAAEHPICSTVYFAAYIKPIAFQLPNGAMVMHAGPHGYMHLPKHVFRLCLHESLHGFPGSGQALKQQDELLKSNKQFKQQYDELIVNYHSGPEEYIVVGAEAYLSEKLMLRTQEDCISYLKSQNGGMPLSLAIYERLRETNPENGYNWCGYGKWLEKELLTLKM